MVSVHIGGGGIRATFVAQCLDDLFKTYPSVLQDLDVATGVSAGSIVASCIATETSLSDTLDYLNTRDFVAKKISAVQPIRFTECGIILRIVSMATNCFTVLCTIYLSQKNAR